MDYNPSRYTLEYIDMARIKTKVVKTRHRTDEPASRSGENNDYSGQFSSSSKEGDHNHNSGGVS